MQDELRKTPLHEVHRASGARMVEFAGWEMPVHYGSQLEEHHAVRRDAGMFDVSHMLVIDIVGAHARGFLRRLLANDVDRLRQPGKALYTCMLNPDGGVVDDLIVYFFAPDRYRVVVNAGTADKDLAWMERAATAASLVLTPRRDLAMIAVQGPHARERVLEVLPPARDVAAALAPFSAAVLDGDMMVARTGYTGEDGFEIVLPATAAPALWQALAERGVTPAGLGARDTLRLEAGMCLYGQDMDEHSTPFECGLAWTVALEPGRDFIGRAALMARAPRAQMLGLVLEGKGVMRSHQTVYCAGGRGVTTSGGFAPTLGGSIALARLPREVAAGARVKVGVRDRQLDARVVTPPFVRRGKVLVQ